MHWWSLIIRAKLALAQFVELGPIQHLLLKSAKNNVPYIRRVELARIIGLLFYSRK